MTLTDHMCQKRGRKRTCQHWRQRWYVDTTTSRLHTKRRGKTDCCSYQKQYLWYEDHRNNNNQKTKMGRKQLYGRFKRLTSDISYDKRWTWLRKGNRKRETESLLIAAQNNAIRTNHIKVRIDETQQNNRCRLCGDSDETINHIISEYIISKLAQKEYMTRLDWVSKFIHWELCKKLKFDHTNKYYLYNHETVLENETYFVSQNPIGKLLWDFEIT